MALIMGVINCFYAYVFYFGGYLRWNKIEHNGELYSPGQIITIMFAIVFGAFMIGMVMPHLKSISEGQIAAKLAYDVIDHTPKIDPNSGGQALEKVDRKTAEGTFEFKNVSFKYPSRDDLLVLDNFSCVMKANQTSALVGPSGSGKSTCIQLIERFYDPTDGQVLLDGKDLRTYDLRSVR